MAARLATEGLGCDRTLPNISLISIFGNSGHPRNVLDIILERLRDTLFLLLSRPDLLANERLAYVLAKHTRLETDCCFRFIGTWFGTFFASRASRRACGPKISGAICSVGRALQIVERADSWNGELLLLPMPPPSDGRAHRREQGLSQRMGGKAWLDSPAQQAGISAVPPRVLQQSRGDAKIS